MDARLLELERGRADDEIEAIVRLHNSADPPPAIRIITQFDRIITCRLNRGDIHTVRRDERVASMKAPLIVRPTFDALESAGESTGHDAASDTRRPDLDVTGQGAVVGVVDWGCDFTHANLRHEDGRTRLLALWDQAAAYRTERPNIYGYGAVYEQEEIDHALLTVEPDATLGYSWRKADPADAGAHGTHVIDIAAGSGRVGPSGIAPGAALVFVHLGLAGPHGQPSLGSSVRLIEAVDFIFRVAGERPVCINLSIGRQIGPHDGTTLTEQALDAAVAAAPGRFIAHSGGNYYDRDIHASGQLRPGQVVRIPFEVSEADVTPNEIEVWYSGRDVMSVQVAAPDGVESKRTGLEDESAIRVDDRVVCRVYHRAREPNNLDNTINVFVYTSAPAGQWELILHGDDIVDGRFDAWVERDAGCTDCQARFTTDAAVGLTTTGTICNGFRTVAVGAYDGHDPDRGLAVFSSAGPTRDGRVKPDLIAPGVQVLAARSTPRDTSAGANLLVRKSGTSMASPHVVGTVALMFEAAGRLLPIHESRNLLLTSARPVSASGEDTHRVGSGCLDTDAAVARAAPHAHAGVDQHEEVSTVADESESTPVPLPSEGMPEDESLSNALAVADEAPDLGTQLIEAAEDTASEFARSLPTHYLSNVVDCVGVPNEFDTIAVAGGPPRSRLRRGDVLVRRAPDDGYVHVAFIAGPEVLWHERAWNRGWQLEGSRPGYYARVVEAGPRPRGQAAWFARRVLDAEGRSPRGQTIMRVRDERPDAAGQDDFDASEQDVPTTMTPAHAGGAMGELDAAFALGERGFSIVIGPGGPSGHRLTEQGFDIVAFHPTTGQVWIVDNKASGGTSTAQTATALTVNFRQNLAGAIQTIRGGADFPGRATVVRNLESALSAHDAGRPLPSNVTRYITNAGGYHSGISARLRQQGVQFLDLTGVATRRARAADIQSARRAGDSPGRPTTYPQTSVTPTTVRPSAPPVQMTPSPRGTAMVSGGMLALTGANVLLNWLGDRVQQQRVEARLNAILPGIEQERQRLPDHGVLMLIKYHQVNPPADSLIIPGPVFSHIRWAMGRTRDEARQNFPASIEPAPPRGSREETTVVWIPPLQLPSVGSLRTPFRPVSYGTFASPVLQDVKWGGVSGFDDEGETSVRIPSGTQVRFIVLEAPAKVYWQYSGRLQTTNIPLVSRPTSRSGESVTAVDLDPVMFGNVAAVPVFPYDAVADRVFAGAPATRDNLGQLPEGVYPNIRKMRWIRPQNLRFIPAPTPTP